MGAQKNLLSASRIISLARNHTPNAAAWIDAVPRSARNQMNMAMHDCLSGGDTHVDAHVVAVRLASAVQ